MQRSPKPKHLHRNRLSAAGDSPEVRRLKGSLRARNVQSALMFCMAVALVATVSFRHGAPGVIALLGLASLSVKMVLAVLHAPATSTAPMGLRVAAVVPVYNEDPVALEACLRSLLAQSRPLDEIWVVDDGSDSPDCYQLAGDLLRGVPGARVLRQPNGGKRHAQAQPFANAAADVFCTVDSDTVLDPSAVAEGLRPFADTRVMAVTGNVRVMNATKNLLTRLTALRYANAFLWERAAYSRLGSVVCCCGSLSFWRASVVRENLEDYLGQTFLGVKVPYGDDRRLTNYSLLAGRVVLQDTSIGYTVVPERLGHYLNQQIRWNKSFFRESLWAIRNFNRLRAVWMFTFAELSLWGAALTSLVWIWLLRPAVTGELALWTIFFTVVMSYVRSIRYLGTDVQGFRFQLATFALAPAYSILSTFVLLPLRLVSLAQLKSTAWGTREVIEVRMGAALAPLKA